MNLRERIKARGDNAYIQALNVCRNDNCLGENFKMEKGQFGPNELKCHREASELFGMHKAYYEVIKMMDEEVQL